MDGFSDVFRMGGPMMYLLVLAGLAHALVAIVQFATIRKVDLTPLLWSGVVGLALLGVLGTVMGQIQAFKAVAYASAEQKQALLASGVAISMYTTAAGLVFATIGAAASGIAATLVKRFGPAARREG